MRRVLDGLHTVISDSLAVSGIDQASLLVVTRTEEEGDGYGIAAHFQAEAHSEAIHLYPSDAISLV
jgi:hypothetical protein